MRAKRARGARTEGVRSGFMQPGTWEEETCVSVASTSCADAANCAEQAACFVARLDKPRGRETRLTRALWFGCVAFLKLGS
jgi:hypothetical protein